MTSIITQVAMKAAILHQGKLLLLTEAATDVSTQNGKNQLPGGRINPGEPHIDGLLREVKEETGMSVTVGMPIATGEWSPVIKGQKTQIVATFFVAYAEDSNVKLSHEHSGFLWIEPRDYLHHNTIETEKHVFEKLIELITKDVI